jgi:Mce-associated membrane protein
MAKPHAGTAEAMTLATSDETLDREEAEAVEPPGDPSAGNVAEPLDGRSPVRKRRQLVAAALGVVVAAAAVATVLQALEYRADAERDNARSEAVAVAGRVAVGLATISPKTAARDIEALAALGTEDFAKELRTNLDQQVELIKKNRVSSTGEIREAGLVSLEGDEASVAIAIASTVTNRAGAKGEQRWYRMTIQLERQGDGSWLASEVEFVQ